jgi:phosphopantetheinyl transferase
MTTPFSLQARALRFGYGEFGKPVLRPEDKADEIRFNASGAQGRVAICGVWG